MRQERNAKMQNQRDTILQRVMVEEAVQAMAYLRRQGASSEDIATTVEEAARSLRTRERSKDDVKEDVMIVWQQLKTKFPQRKKDTPEYTNQTYGLSIITAAFARSPYNNFFRYLASLQKNEREKNPA